jgi:uncharacterized protein YggT (Ycf19 family)
MIMDRDLYRRQRQREAEAARTERREDFYEAMPAAPAAPLPRPAYTRSEAVVAEPALVRPERASRVVGVVVAVIEFLLLVRLLFRALAANSAHPLVQFVYAVTRPLIAPFVGIFSLPRLGVAAFEVATVTAMIVYAVVGYLIIALIRAVRGRGMRDF